MKEALECKLVISYSVLTIIVADVCSDKNRNYGKEVEDRCQTGNFWKQSRHQNSPIYQLEERNPHSNNKEHNSQCN